MVLSSLKRGITGLFLDEIPLEETGDEVEVRVDEYGVSHVFADSLESLAFAQGYLQAKDRLFQMDLLRHVGYGDSAKIVGGSQLASDIQVSRDLYQKETIEKQFEEAPERAKKHLWAYADGVNARINEVRETGDLPGEFLAMQHIPEKWTPIDSLAIINYMIGFFGVFGGDELDNARRLATLRKTLGEDDAEDAFNDLNWLTIPDEHYTSIEKEDLEIDHSKVTPEPDHIPDEQLDLADAALNAEKWGLPKGYGYESGNPVSNAAQGLLTGLKWGSNAMVIDGEHTETGNPMMFGGPQMGVFKPPVLHEIGFHGEDIDVVGVGVVGSPGIVIGRTPEFAWTATSGYDDMIDHVVIELDPDDRYRYKVDGEWREMETETVVHKPSLVGGVLNGEPKIGKVKQEIARVELGDKKYPVVAWNEEENIAWVQKPITRMNELNGSFNWALVGEVDTYEGFKEQLEEFPFGFNFHYIDEDRIALIHTGTIPERNPDLDPRLPAPEDEHSWSNIKQGSDLGIHVENPDKGYIVNWNNAPAPGYTSGDTWGQWGQIHRVEILRDVVEEKLEEGDIDTGDIADIIDEAAYRDSNAHGSAEHMIEAASESDDDLINEMGEMLKEWRDNDFNWRAENGTYHPGHVIWDEVRLELQQILFSDKLGSLTPELKLDPPKMIDPDEDEDPHAGDHGRTLRDNALVHILRGDAEYDWFEGRDKNEVLLEAFMNAKKTLIKRFKEDDASKWRMKAHNTQFMALGGGFEDKIDMLNRGSFNEIIAIDEDGDFSAESVLPPSNNAHMNLSQVVKSAVGDEPSHMTNQLDLFLENRYKDMPLSTDEVEDVSVSSETISVRRNQSQKE